MNSEEYNIVKKKIICIIISLFFYADIPFISSIAFADPIEDKALDELAQKMLSQSDKLKGKRIGVFKFTSIEGKETPEGARVSQSLLEKLMSNSSLSFIERSELHKIITENELGQTGLIDSSLTNDNGKILPIDFMITGTFAKINSKATISARVVNANTGELYMVKSCQYDSKQNVNTTDSPEAIALFKQSPDTLDRMNKVFFNLQNMSENAPLVFLITVLDKSELERLENNRPKAAEALRKRIEKLKQENPQRFQKIADLRKGLAEMKESFPKRYDIIMAKKTEIFNNRLKRK
jgi:hypothetical protein